MGKSVVTRRQKKKMAAKPKTLFEKKWAQVEKKQQRNRDKVTQINHWYEYFEQSVLPAEKMYLTANEKLLSHLAGFFKRKSLAQYQRDELFEWLREILHRLETNPFYDQDRIAGLHQQVNEAVGVFLANENEKVKDEPITQSQIDKAREALDEMFEGQKTFTDEQVEDFIRDPNQFEEELLDMFEEFVAAELADDDEFDQDATDDESDFEEHFNPFGEESFEQFNQRIAEQSAQRQRLKNLFDDAELGKIYKQLANKLHPDKETDEQQKAYKSEQMGLLSKAKKAKDAFTLIQMFQTHLPEKAREFDPNLSQSLCQLLDEKLAQLDRDYDDTGVDMGLAGMIWARFGAKSDKQIKHNFREYLLFLDQERKNNEEIVKDVTNLKSLKSILVYRAESYDYEDAIDDVLEELFASDKFAHHFSEFEEYDDDGTPF